MLIQAIAIVFVLGIIVLIHEWGHFMAARSIGIAVQEFAIGVGPALWKKQGKNTLFSLRCLPVGGYCLFDSDLEGVDHRGRPLSILGRKAPAKIYVSLAGPVMNFVLASLLFMLLFSFIGLTVGYEAVIGEVQADSPAQAAGIMAGDRILSIDGQSLISWQDLSRILSEKAGQENLEFVMQRGDQEVITQVTPRYHEDEGRILIGVVVDASKTIVEKVNPFQAVFLGLKQTFVMIAAMVGAIIQMITGQISVSENLSGPVALVQIIGETASSGFVNTLFLTAFLSVNLGIMNLLPVPALDGGKIVVYIIELVRRKPMKLEVEGWLNMVGFALLISLMLLLTFKDIFRVFGGS